MTLKLWLCTAFFLGPIVVVTSSCGKKDSGCQRNNNIDQKDTTVYPISAVNCSFVGSLCCYRQGCVDVGMGQWNAMNGHASVREQSQGCILYSYSVLESPWVNFTTPSCVEFKYLRPLPYQLQVFLTFRNGTPPSKLEVPPPEYDGKNRTVHLNIEYLTGKIQFRCQGGGGRCVQPLKIFYVRITEGRCQTNASSQHLEVSDPSTCDVLTTNAPTTVHTTSSTNTLLTPSSTAASTASQPTSTRKSTEMTGGDGDNDSNDGGSDSNVGVIVGVSVAAVAAVVVLVITLIAYRRKVHARKPKGGKRNLIGKSAPTGADNTALGPDDPYEMAEDGAPGQNHNYRTDDYSYIDTGESSHQSHHQANGTLDDDYSCIGDTQNLATGVQGKNTAPSKPDPRDVYSVVNKPGKKTPTPVYSLAKTVGDKQVLPNPNDVYSVVNKKGKKPDLAPKPGHSDTEYNTISHKGNNSSQKAAGDATSDTYNRIGGVASLGSKGQSQESAVTEKGSLADEYNTLDFTDTRLNAPRKEKSGAARAAYDHVRNDPDDPYNKTQIGKRNVVIGSDYDHVKP